MDVTKEKIWNMFHIFAYSPGKPPAARPPATADVTTGCTRHTPQRDTTMRCLHLSTSRTHAGQAPRQRGGGDPRHHPQSSYWVVVLPLAVKAIWEKWECAVAPCHGLSSAGMWTTSP